MMKIKYKYVGVFFIAWIFIFLTGCRMVQMNPAQFLQNNHTFSAYSLFDDNTNPKTTYDHLKLFGSTSETTYTYESLTGDERYLFTTIPGMNENPILSYFRVSSNNDNGSLLGIGFGEQTIVFKNDTLGITKTYSIYEYLKDEGFEYNFDFPVKYSNDLGDDKILWYYLKKDNIFINYAVHIDNYLKLHSYEVGIIDESVYDMLKMYTEGYTLTIDSNNHTLVNTYETVYAVGDYINVVIEKSNKSGTTKLYVNDVYVKDFEYNGYQGEASFYMYAKDVVVRIVTE